MTQRILVVDDEEAIREVVTTMLEGQGYECVSVGNGRLAQEQLEKNSLDLVLSDMVMPELDGLSLLEWSRRHKKDVPVVMVTAMHDLSIALDAIRRGAYDYVLKPFEKDQLFVSVRRALEHRRLIVENKAYQQNLENLNTSLEKIVDDRTARLSEALDQLEESYDYTLEALGAALDMKDAETEGHCQRVTAFTIAIAKTMKVDAALLPQIARGAFLHDIGKMAIPDNILRKAGPLDDQERSVMRQHSQIGYDRLSRIPFLREAAEIVLSHQEFYNGTGYPRGLKKEEIPLGARIFAVADTLDAMTSDRPYRSALPISAARDEILRCSGTQFDPDVVKVFLAMPSNLWVDLRENASSAFRLSRLKKS